MQRSHNNDLSGYLLKNQNWEYLKIPVISQNDEKIHYKNFSYFRKKGNYFVIKEKE